MKFYQDVANTSYIMVSATVADLIRGTKLELATTFCVTHHYFPYIKLLIAIYSQYLFILCWFNAFTLLVIMLKIMLV